MTTTKMTGWNNYICGLNYEYEYDYDDDDLY